MQASRAFRRRRLPVPPGESEGLADARNWPIVRSIAVRESRRSAHRVNACIGARMSIGGAFSVDTRRYYSKILGGLEAGSCDCRGTQAAISARLWPLLSVNAAVGDSGRSVSVGLCPPIPEGPRTPTSCSSWDAADGWLCPWLEVPSMQYLRIRRACP
jgi:hypothetical protein